MKKIYKQKVIPVVETIVKKDKIFLRIELPAVELDEIELELEGQLLLVKAEMNIDIDADEKISSMEFGLAIFALELELSEEIDTNEVETSFERGLLMLGFNCKKKDVKNKN